MDPGSEPGMTVLFYDLVFPCRLDTFIPLKLFCLVIHIHKLFVLPAQQPYLTTIITVLYWIYHDERMSIRVSP